MKGCQILKYPQDNRSNWSPIEFDNFPFFIHETFLYTIAIALKNEKFKFIEEIFYSGYFFQGKISYKNEPRRFDALYNYVESFDKYYKETYSKNFISPMADLIITRIPENITKDDLINADLLCHYISVMENLSWFPITYIYRPEDYERFDLFKRLVSQRHFEKVKSLFNVQTVKELQEKIKAIKESYKNVQRTGYSGAFYSVIPIYQLIDIEKIGTIR